MFARQTTAKPDLYGKEKWRSTEVVKFKKMDSHWMPLERNTALLTLWFCIRRRQCQPTPVLLPGKSHGWRSLVGCSPRGHKESDTTEQLPFDFSLSCIGEGNGNPLQCSCLENPRDGGAWWAAVYEVAQSWTWLKLLSSSNTLILAQWYFKFLLSRALISYICIVLSD